MGRVTVLGRQILFASSHPPFRKSPEPRVSTKIGSGERSRAVRQSEAVADGAVACHRKTQEPAAYRRVTNRERMREVNSTAAEMVDRVF